MTRCVRLHNGRQRNSRHQRTADGERVPLTLAQAACWCGLRPRSTAAKVLPENLKKTGIKSQRNLNRPISNMRPTQWQLCDLEFGAGLELGL